MKTSSVYYKVAFWALWLALVAVCAYFIFHNAQWFIRDDAIVISHTGFGKAFLPSGTTIPQAGRFYPFAYLAYDVLLLFGGDHISPTAHYVLQAVFFVIFVVAVTWLSLSILEGQKAIWKYSIALLATIVFVGRVYVQYTECFSSIWSSYSLVAVFMLCFYLFYKKQKWGYGIIALLCINYYCYCLETNFALPLSMGIGALVFQRKTLSSKERVFNWLLVGSALLYLMLYAVIVLPYIESAYDGAHGQEVSIFGNAVRMLWAQKLLLLAIVVLIVRLYDIIKNKKEYSFYDNLLITAGACCFANFALKLNWTMYYYISALLVLPSILHCSMEYLKEKWTLVLFVLLAMFYGRKIPNTIKENQEQREIFSREMSFLSKSIDEVDAVYWYAPEPADYSFELELRDWRYSCLCTYLGWLKHDSDYAVEKSKEFREEKNTLWLTAYNNWILFPDDTQLMECGKRVFDVGVVQGFFIGEE